MRSRVKDGKLVEPRSLPAGVSRRARLVRDLQRVQWHLADPRRREVYYKTDDAYNTWVESARAAEAAFARELELLDEWLAPRILMLFREAYQLLKTIQTDGGIEDPDEVKLMQRLDAFFAAATPIPTAKVDNGGNDGDEAE